MVILGIKLHEKSSFGHVEQHGTLGVHNLMCLVVSAPGTNIGNKGGGRPGCAGGGVWCGGRWGCYRAAKHSRYIKAGQWRPRLTQNPLAFILLRVTLIRRCFISSISRQSDLWIWQFSTWRLKELSKLIGNGYSNNTFHVQLFKWVPSRPFILKTTQYYP